MAVSSQQDAPGTTDQASEEPPPWMDWVTISLGIILGFALLGMAADTLKMKLSAPEDGGGGTPAPRPVSVVPPAATGA